MTTEAMSSSDLPVRVLDREGVAAWRAANPPLDAARVKRNDSQFREPVRRPATLNLRAKGDDSMRVLEGYACVTEHPYEMWDMQGPYLEKVSATAFNRTLNANPQVVLLVNHEGLPLADTRSGTLRLESDDTGLRFDADLDLGESDAAIVARKVDRGILKEASFAFQIVKGRWNDDFTEYTIQEVNLQRGDVSVVTYGANPATSLDMEDPSERDQDTPQEDRQDPEPPDSPDGPQDDSKGSSDWVWMAQRRLSLQSV